VSAVLPVFAVDADDLRAVAVLASCGLLLHFGFSTFVFAGEPIGPSRRVVAHWDRDGAGAVRRFLGPGIVRTTTLEMLLGVGTITAIAVVCSIGVELAGPRITDPAEHLGQI